jgi:hypothetical protein
MYLFVQKILDKNKYEGNYKNVEPTETRWKVADVDHVKYGYIQSGGRFKRENVSYIFIIRKSCGDNESNQKMILGSIDWYSMISPEDILKNLLNKEKIIQIKDKFYPSEEEFEELVFNINTEISKCTKILETELKNSEEYKITEQNKKRIERWLKAKIRFDKEYGFGYFEEIYNFDLELMNYDLLEQVRQKKRRYDSYKQTKENSGNSNNKEKDEGSSVISNSLVFSQEEIAYLKKFYKTLAKNYHPDICHDDGKAMQFLNKLKKHWNI